MPLYIGKKLDFLMRLTNTSNAMLGRALNFDSSHISRIRADKRGVPHKQPFMDPAARYFAKVLAQSQQQHLATGVICPDSAWPDDIESAAALISAWLADPAPSDTIPDNILFSPLIQGTSMVVPTEGTAVCNRRGTAFFYGNAGKRESTLLFLSDLCEMETPPMLLLYSDEDMSWFSEDTAFVTQWGLLVARYLSKGGKIRIIHNVGRDLHEMLTALQKWMPLYMYGEIEAFYYPKLRDQFLRRTLFIAKYHSTLVSASIGSQTDGMVNMLINHIDATKAFTQEFDNMLAQCKPLMQVYRPANSLPLFAGVSHFEEAMAPLITMGNIPPLFSLPPDTARNMQMRFGSGLSEKPTLVQHVQTAQENVLALLSAGHAVTDIILLPDTSQVHAGKLYVPICDFLGLPGLTYTASDLAAQLRNVIQLLKKQKTYQVILAKPGIDNVFILCKENLGAYVFPAAPHGTIFGISERELTLSLWEFLNRTAPPRDKTQTISALEKYIESLLNYH